MSFSARESLTGRLRRGAAGLAIIASLPVWAATAAPAAATRAPVFFRSWSAALDPAALMVIKHVAQLLQRSPSVSVQVVGYADLDGSAAANRLLSELRAQVVADRLLQDGVEPARIHQSGSGATGVEQHAQESRRVILVVSPD